MDIGKMKEILEGRKIKFDYNESDENILLQKYIKIKKKYFVIFKKLNVEYSSAYKKKKIFFTKKQNEVLKDIENRIKEGRSIKPYLSNSLYLNKASKEDELLNENIYHLHLNLPDSKEHFVKRTDKLLFMTYDENNVYFLDVKSHPVGDWTKIISNDMFDEARRSEIDKVLFENVEELDARH